MKKQNKEEQDVKNNDQSGVDAAEMGEQPDNTEEIKQEIEDKNQADETPEENELDRLQAELDESKDKYLRLYSEFENFRRRTSKEKLEMVQTASEDLMSSLLSVLDDFERAEKSFEDKNTELIAVKNGVALVQNKFRKTLEQKGLVTMDTKEGTDFNPDLHEAITQIPAPKPKLKGKVVDVIEKGYLLKDKVIRYAKVVIGS